MMMICIQEDDDPETLQRRAEKEIEKLSNMLSKIQNLYYKKKEDLEELKSEIDELRDVLNVMNSLVSGKSFHSADEIYSKALAKKTDKQTEDEYFVEKEVRYHKVTNSVDETPLEG